MRYSRRRRSVPWLSGTLFMPAHLVSLLIRWRQRASSTHLRLYIRAVFDVLPEVADVAAELLVGLDGEGYDRNEAECKPFPTFHGTGGHVATVLTLEGEILGAGKA